MLKLSAIASVFTLLFAAALPLPSQSTKPDLEEKLIGGPCQVRTQLGPGFMEAQRALNRKHDAAIKAGDDDAVIAARKELIRRQCRNHYLWFYLAAFYVEIGKNAEAVTILEYLYDKKNNEIDRRLLTEGNALHPLTKTPTLQQSALAKKLSADRARQAQRKQEFQQQLDSLPSDRKPQSPHIAEDACPFECCMFRTWDVLSDIVLYDKPNGQSIVGRVRKREKVEGLTGEVHIEPIPVGVRHSPGYSEIKAGSIVFLLDRLGEGIGRCWSQGKVFELGVSGNIHEHCPFPDKRCWGEYIHPVPTQDDLWGTWWVKVKTQGGVVGWTKDRDQFGNMGGCG